MGRRYEEEAFRNEYMEMQKLILRNSKSSIMIGGAHPHRREDRLEKGLMH